MEVVDYNLASIEKEYTATKDKLSKEIEGLKASHKSEVEKLKKEYDDKLDKVKESYVVVEKKLKEDAASQGELISKLTKEKDEAYEEGFRYALEQVKLIFPDLDEKRLGEADALNQIVDGKLVPFTLPEGQ
ncbi:hypothetical protein A2U01_0000988 [Trifolium medium]|uniref:Uncharacterized protein n=1 Tax=Trifolium medium TaxID=97028 RepID=A0A392LYZ7_9FABA|nr:hypothetical protein [Trifolium medium]